jgi:membrane-anchored mycosin MYCP
MARAGRAVAVGQRARLGGVGLALSALSALLAATAVAGVAPAGGVPTVLDSTGGGAAGRNFGGPGRCATPSTEVKREVPWEGHRLSAWRVWPLTRGEGVTVGVIDTGVDRTAPQLAGRVMAGVDVVNGGGRADDDCFGHGTFVAGIIGAGKQPGVGLAGVAPGVKILPIRQANGYDDGSALGMAQSLVAAVDGGARVINISASSFFPTAELKAAVDYAAAKDVLIVTAASNEAERGNPKAYPAAYPGVVAVGAVGPDGGRSEFSETGSFLSVVAPGQDITGISRGGTGHVQDSGTSYAAPFVAGVAALVRAYRPELSAAQVKRRMEVTADHPGTSLPDPALGWGVVNPWAAVTTEIPEERGGAAAPAGLAGIDPPAKPVPVTWARDNAVLLGGAAGVAALLVLAATAVGPRGARRGWAPAGRRLGRPGRPGQLGSQGQLGRQGLGGQA